MHTLTKLAASFIHHLKPDRVKERGQQPFALPAPQPESSELLRLLARRRSSREFDPRPLPLPVLSNLLWAAFGINRPATGARTAPSALNAQEIDIYVALSTGLYIFDPSAHGLHLVREVDARRVTGFQDFVDEAPLDLIYVADLQHVKNVPVAEEGLYAAASAGAIAQNVYLFCAAEGLSTVVRGWFDHKAVESALKLGTRERVLLAQTVGYPAAPPS